MARRLNEYDNRSEALRHFDAIAAVARQAGKLHDPRVIKALQVIKSNPGNTRTVQDVTRQTLQWLKATPDFQSQDQDPCPFRPFPDQRIRGSIRFGQAYNPVAPTPIWFGLHPAELNQNVLLGGRAGSGKTNLFMVVISGLVRLLIPWWILDFKKDYRHLIRRYPNLLVLNRRNLKFNPLVPPPGTDPVYWIQVFTDIFFEAFFPTPAAASKVAFLEFLEGLFIHTERAFGPATYPSFYDLHGALEAACLSKSSRGTDSARSRLLTCLSRVRPLLRILNEMFDCQSGYPLPELLERNVVFEMDGLTQEIQEFLTNILLQWVFHYRLNTAQRGRLLHVLMFDEAKMVFAKDRASGSSSISRLVSTAREMGQAIVCADQMPSALGHALLANVFTTVSLNLSATRDINEMAYAMGLNTEQRQFLGRLPVGTGVVRMADRFPDPFVIRIPEYPIVKNVNDEELSQCLAKSFADLAFEPRLTDAGGEVQEGHEEDSPTAKPSPLEPSLPDQPELSDTESLFLSDVRNHPFIPKVERYRSLHLTNYMGNKVSRELMAKGFLEEVSVRLGQGNAAKYLRFTSQAEETIGKQNLGPGKGGFEHVLHQHRLRDRFIGMGFDVQIEAHRDGKAVDLGLRQGEEEIAIEVAMSAAGELENILKDIQANWTRIWTVSPDRRVLEQVSAQWEARKCDFPAAAVTFYVISEILADSWEVPS